MRSRNYVGTPLDSLICVREVFTVHYFEYTKDFYGEGESHDFWEMVYVDCGRIQVTGGENVFVLEQGEAYFHCPNEYHNIVSTDVFSSVFIISFSTQSPDASLLAHCRVSLGGTEKRLITRILEETDRNFVGPLDIMDQTQLVPKSDAPYGGRQMLRLLLEQLLLHIIRGKSVENISRQRKPSVEDGKEVYIVNNVVAFLTENLDERLTVEEICKNVLFSKSYVEKIFREHLGCGVIQYFNYLKIREAKRMISEGELSFTEISDRLKFNSVHYFSRLFKAVVGMNPTEYKRSVNKRGLL